MTLTLPLSGLYWTGSTLDFTFHIGSKESDLTVLKSELVIISYRKLQAALMLSRHDKVRVTVAIHYLTRSYESVHFPIFNETYLITGADLPRVSGYISANLTPYMRRESLDLPRFRVKMVVREERRKLPYTVQDLLLESTGCTSPFLVITTSKKQELAYVTNIIERKKRGVTGFTPDHTQPNTIQYQDVTQLETPSFPCQKVSFDLNLADIGWDSWMLIPKMVDIGVCQGTCNDMNGLIPHALAKHKISQVMRDERIGKICCQEASYKEIVALYQVDGSLVKSILPQFVVSSCKCR